MHAYGNAFIHPFNYAGAESTQLRDEYPKADVFYKAVWTSGLMPTGMVYGNFDSTVNYPVNGGASDYMLATHNIYAISVMLGTTSVSSQQFYLDDAIILKSVCDVNYPWFTFAMT